MKVVPDLNCDDTLKPKFATMCSTCYSVLVSRSQFLQLETASLVLATHRL